MKKNLIKILIFVLIFFFLWILRQYLYSHYEISLTGPKKAFIGIALKIIIWIGFSIIFSKLIFKENIFEKLRFEKNKLGVLYAILLSFILLFLNLILNYVSKGYFFDFSIDVGSYISAVIFAPIIEEFVFRGFILEKLKGSLHFFYANLITALLFLLIHFPGWLIWGDGISIESSVSIFFVGFIWGYLYKKTNSLLSPILAHSLNNLISMIV